MWVTADIQLEQPPKLRFTSRTWFPLPPSSQRASRALRKILPSSPLRAVLPSPCQRFISSEWPFSSLESHLTKPRDTARFCLSPYITTASLAVRWHVLGTDLYVQIWHHDDLIKRKVTVKYSAYFPAHSRHSINIIYTIKHNTPPSPSRPLTVHIFKRLLFHTTPALSHRNQLGKQNSKYLSFLKIYLFLCLQI